MQATRRRLDRERVLRALRGARCATCHRSVWRDGMTSYRLDRFRRTRVCLACVQG